MRLIPAMCNRIAFINLFNLYIHELSKYNVWLGKKIDKRGYYLSQEVNEYFSEKSKNPYVIFDDSHPIGLFVYSYPTEKDEEDGCNCYIEEMFVIETSRKQGVAENVCKTFWSRINGVCGLCVLKENHSAITFWEKLIERCGYQYDKVDADGQMWFYRVFVE